MPVVTVDPESYERYELNSAPADESDPTDEQGYVFLRPLPYGMKLSRRSKATKMMMRSQPATSRKQAQQQEQTFEIESMDEWAVAFDFAYCIGEHNLKAGDGKLIDFGKNTHMKIKMLDPKVGTEIEMLIDNLNNAEDEESMEDFLKRRDTLSLAETDSSEKDGAESLQEPEPTPIA
jgi:hypothetical protein